MADARYYAGAAGRCYLYAKEATMRCPYAEEIPRSTDDHRAMPLMLEVEELIEAHAVEPFNVMRLMAKAHRQNTTAAHPEQPDTCNSCGARLVKVGYRTWIEAPVDDPIHEGTVNEVTRSINQAFGATHLLVRGSARYWPTKREAMAWAREEAAIDKQAAREALT